MKQVERCFVCNKKLGENPKLVDTRDGQLVYVGMECYKKIVAAGEAGYSQGEGFVKLYLIKEQK